jgi:hypothetical protein
MSMMDFASALGGAGGGAPPGADPGGAPPDLGAPPPDQGAPPDDTGQGGEQTYSTSLEALQVAEDALHAFIQMDPDHGDRAIAAQCLQNVLKLQAANQDSSNSGDLSSLKRALGQGPGANAGPVGQAAAAAGPPPGPPGGGY